jgi:hypothetical protein
MKASRYPLSNYSDHTADIIAGRAYTFDNLTGVRNRWSDCSFYEMARAIHVENGRNPHSMRRDDVILHRENEWQAPFITNTMTQSDFPGVMAGALLTTVDYDSGAFRAGANAPEERRLEELICCMA